MTCKNCGKQIEDDKIFCKSCEDEIKKISSRSELNELKKLIESQQSFSDMDDTKVLYDINDINKDIIINNTVNSNELPIKELTREEKNKEEYETLEKENIKEEEVKEESKNPKKNKTKLIIIISIIILLLISLIGLFLLFNKKDKQEEPVVVDYEKVLNEYGDALKSTLKEYLKEKNEEPSIEEINKLLDYKKHEIKCEEEELYSDSKVYLNKCVIDNKKVKYTYGEKQEIKESTKIDIYVNNNYYSSNEEGTLYKTIMCHECTLERAYENRVIVKENNEYYLYDYDSKKEFGPFNMEDKNLLSYNSVLYGIIFKDNTKNLYSISSKKTFKNIKGELLEENINFTPSIMYKYGYLVLRNNNTNNFINLKTGNISYKIDNKISNFIESPKNNIVYITTYTTDINKFKVYNSNGKQLFQDIEYTKIMFLDDYIYLMSSKGFETYDYDSNLIQRSKTYTKLLGLYDKYIAVLDKNIVKIVNFNDKELVAFKDTLDSKYEFNENLSGKKSKDNKEGIYLTFENKNSKDDKIEYYYIIDTLESGITKNNN